MRFLLRPLALVFILFICSCASDLSSDQYLARAQAHIKENNFSAAVLELKNALKKDSDNTTARALLGEMYLRGGHIASAEKELLLAKELGANRADIDPMLAQVQVSLGKGEEVLKMPLDDLTPEAKATLQAAQGMALLHAGKQSAAAFMVDEALSSDKESEYARIAEARILLAEGNTSEAKNALENVTNSNPGSATSWSILGDIEWQEKNYTEAEAAYSAAIKNRENNLKDRLNRAFIRIQLQEYEEAQAEISELLRIAPGNPGINLAQGLLYLNQLELEEAQSSFEAAITEDQRYPLALYLLAIIHYENANLASAEDYVSVYNTIDPQSIPGIELFATLKINQREFDEAESIIRPVLSEETTDPDVLNLMASALLNGGKTDEAIDLLKRVAVLYPNSSYAKVKLASSYIIEGNRQLGIKQFRSALELEPDDDLANTLLILNFLENGERDSALRAAMEYVANAPESQNSHNMLGEVYLKTGETEKAQTEFNRAREIAPGDPKACHSLAEIAIDLKEYTTAEQLYEEVLSEREFYLPTIMRLAKLEAIRGNTNEMIVLLQQAIEAHPEAVEPRLAIARYFLASNQADEVVILLEEIKQSQEENAEFLSLLATSYLDTKQYLIADRTVDKLIKLRPEFSTAHYLKARALIGLNKPMAAEGELKVKLNSDPGHFPSLIAISRLMLERQQLDEFKQYVLHLTEQYPDNPDVLALRAESARIDGDNELALKLYEKAYAAAPTTSLMLSLARQQLTLEQPEAAQITMEEWLETRPDDVPALLSLAEFYGLTKDSQAQEQTYGRVLEIEASNAIALNNLAWLLRKSNPVEALDYARRAQDTNPESADNLDTLAVVLLENGKVEEAKRTIEKAIIRSPKNPSLHFHRAQIQLASGDTDSAMEILNALLKEDIEFKERAEAKQLAQEIRSKG